MHRNTMDSYAERLLESVLTSPNTSVTAFLLPEQVTLWEARSGPNSNLKPGSGPASASSIIRSSCDTAAMCLGLFLCNRKVELESSRIWLASVWTMSRGRQGIYGRGGSGNGIKNFDLVEKTKVLHGRQTQQKPFCGAARPSASTVVALVSIEHLDVGGYPDLSLWDASSLPTRITQGHWPRRCVSTTLDWSCSPTAPSHLVPLASLMEKGSDAFPCFYMNGTPPPCHSPYLLHPIRLRFHFHGHCDIAMNGSLSSFTWSDIEMDNPAARPLTLSRCAWESGLFSLSLSLILCHWK